MAAVLVYLNDMIAFSLSLEVHMDHVQQELRLLQNFWFPVKLVKCDFPQRDWKTWDTWLVRHDSFLALCTESKMRAPQANPNQKTTTAFTAQFFCVIGLRIDMVALLFKTSV